MTLPKVIWKVIIASSVGTLTEWYDFYLFGSLSTIIAAKFFLMQIQQQHFYLHQPLLPLALLSGLLALWYSDDWKI